MTQEQLLEKLRLIEALHVGAATEGERGEVRPEPAALGPGIAAEAFDLSAGELR